MFDIQKLQSLSVTLSISILIAFVCIAVVKLVIIPRVGVEKVKRWDDIFKYLLLYLTVISILQSVIGLYLVYKGF